MKNQLADLIAWTPLLHEIAAAAGQPKAPTDSGGSRSVNGSTVEAAADMRDRLAALEARLEALAAEAHAAHSGEETPMPGQPPALILHGLADWIARQAFAADMAREIADIHARAARLVGAAPETSHLLCASCTADGRTSRLVRYPTDDGFPDVYTCPACGHAAIVERDGPWLHRQPIDTLKVSQLLVARAAMEHSDQWAKPATVAKLLLISPATVRTWKHRGEIESNEDGEVSVAQVARLARERKLN